MAELSLQPPIKLHMEPPLNNPVMVAAWPGMGSVAIGAVGYLRHQLQATEFGEIEPYDFFEPSEVVVENSVTAPPRLPQTKFYFWKGRPRQGDLLLVMGDSQPHARPYQYANLIMDVAQRFGVRRLYTGAAAPASLHHRERPKVLAVANEAKLLRYLKGFDLSLMESGQISGMNGLLLGVAAEREVEGICLLGELPYYAVALPCLRSSQVVLEVLLKMLGIQIDMAEMDTMAGRTEDEIDKIVATSEQMSRLVEQLRQPKPQSEPKARPSPEEQAQARERIERLFAQAAQDRSKASELKAELDRLGLFEEYEDRFLALFRKLQQ